MTVNGQTITFKSGSAPAATDLPAGSGVSGNIVTDGNGNSSVYIGTTGTPLGSDGAGSGERHRPRQRRPEDRDQRDAGAAALSNSSGTNAAIAVVF